MRRHHAGHLDRGLLMDETHAPDEVAAGVDTLLAWASSAARREVHFLPPRVIKKALTVICDDIAAMVAASAEPEIQNVNALAVSKAPRFSFWKSSATLGETQR